MTDEERAVWLVALHAALSGGYTVNAAAEAADSAVIAARKRGVIK